MIFVRMVFEDGKEIRSEQPDGLALKQFIDATVKLFACEPLEVYAVELPEAEAVSAEHPGTSAD